MKKVVQNKELNKKMQEAINLLCDTVKTTLGPKCSNIIIDHSTFSPFITNDGVTIAQNIESDDAVVNTILEIAKESSIRTNEKVGDGTTTTLVLLQSIFNNGLKLIENGKNPFTLKKELDETLPNLLDFIKAKSHKPTKDELYNIAKTSANSNEIGEIVANAFSKVKSPAAISIKESNNEFTKMILKKGYIIESLITSPYYFKDRTEINLNNPYVLLLNTYLNDCEEISNILNPIIEKEQELLILAEDYSDLVINQVLSLYLNNNIKIYLLKTPEYGKNKIDLLNDLSLITNSKIIDDLSYINLNYVGTISSITISKDEVTFQIEDNEKIKQKVKELNKLLDSSNDIEESYINKRLSMFSNGLVEIIVGATTETERREKRMRFDDALCAISAAFNGISIGSGIVLYELSEKISGNTDIEKLLKESLKEPFNKIMYNAGLEPQTIINEIKKSNYTKFLNINTNDFEDITKTKVLDPTSVIITSLTNAISIAGMLLTTTSLIINEYQNNLNKVNNFNDL